MWFKKILSVLMVTVCLCTSLCFTAYAEETDITYPMTLSLLMRQHKPQVLFYPLGDIVQIDKGIDGEYDHNVVVTDFYKYNNYSYVAMVSGRSGSSSGLSHWTDNNEVYDEVYPISTNRAKVVHLTTLG